jgi:hypothetical protein
MGLTRLGRWVLDFEELEDRGPIVGDGHLSNVIH